MDGFKGASPSLKICSGVDEAKAIVKEIVTRSIEGGGKISLLEAGGGSLSRLSLERDAVVTVIDISEEQLSNNSYAAHKILGDLHTYKLSQRAYDIIICWDVLEHLHDPKLVYFNFSEAVKIGGLIIVACPNPNSLSGFITMHTPHWFHVMVLRYLFKSKTAGLPGYAPFRTHMRPAMFPQQLQQIAEGKGLKTVALLYYESTRRAALRKNNPAIGMIYDFIINAVRKVSRDQIKLELSDYIFVAELEARYEK